MDYGEHYVVEHPDPELEVHFYWETVQLLVYEIQLGGEILHKETYSLNEVERSRCHD